MDDETANIDEPEAPFRCAVCKQPVTWINGAWYATQVEGVAPHKHWVRG